MAKLMALIFILWLRRVEAVVRLLLNNLSDLYWSPVMTILLFVILIGVNNIDETLLATVFLNFRDEMFIVYAAINTIRVIIIVGL
jgi:hypothetical protein